MYCLDCGNKIEEGSTSCSNCGLSMEEMQERLAVATEMLLYSDTAGVDANETDKLPPVPDRAYFDKQGKVINPADEVNPDDADSSDTHFAGLPRIGSDDPYVTVPIKRIVNEYAEVIADHDRDAKVYIQELPKQKSSVGIKILIACLIVALLAALSWIAWQWYETQKAEQAENSNLVAVDQTERDQINAAYKNLEVYQELTRYYDYVVASYDDVIASVEDFEANYLRSSKEARTEAANANSELRDNLLTHQAGLKKLMDDSGLPEDSPYWAQAAAIENLYNDLITRTSTIAECWEVSLSYDSPKSHSKAILEPLSHDIANGKPASMVDFRENVENARPTYIPDESFEE